MRPMPGQSPLRTTTTSPHPGAAPPQHAGEDMARESVALFTPLFSLKFEASLVFVMPAFTGLVRLLGRDHPQLLYAQLEQLMALFDSNLQGDASYVLATGTARRNARSLCVCVYVCVRCAPFDRPAHRSATRVPQSAGGHHEDAGRLHRGNGPRTLPHSRPPLREWPTNAPPARAYQT